MIHFAIGTKAQFIKMAPVMHLLGLTGKPYHLLDLSQHGSITGKILNDFGLQPRITRMGVIGRSVETYLQAARWLMNGFGEIWFRRRRLRQRWFLDTGGVVLVHGDTLSTLLGFHLARAAALRTGLVEAGLTSHSLLDPFPEECIRRYVGRRADYLFAPDHASEFWLKERKLCGRIVNTRYNTGRDALRLILSRREHPVVSSTAQTEKYGIVTLHRLETLSSSRRLRRAIAHILTLSDTLGELRFYVHPPTENALKKNGLYDTVKQSPRIKLQKLVSYPEFVTALSSAKFVLTDGGSIQEEAAYMNKPCLILRNRTERSDGLNENAILSTWNIEQDAAHLEKKAGAVLAKPDLGNFDASRTILDALREFRN